MISLDTHSIFILFDARVSMTLLYCVCAMLCTLFLSNCRCSDYHSFLCFFFLQNYCELDQHKLESSYIRNSNGFSAKINNSFFFAKIVENAFREYLFFDRFLYILSLYLRGMRKSEKKKTCLFANTFGQYVHFTSWIKKGNVRSGKFYLENIYTCESHQWGDTTLNRKYVCSCFTSKLIWKSHSKVMRSKHTIHKRLTHKTQKEHSINNSNQP